MTTSQQFKSIRRAGVPLCAIETADPRATIAGCCKALNGKQDTVLLCAWDIIQGLQGLNEPGKAFAQDVSPDGAVQSGNPAECLKLLADRAPNRKEDGTGALIVFWHNAQRFLDNESVAQGVWNLRDTFKARGALLVLLAPSLTLPAELKQDVVIITEALPNEAELSAIVDSIAADAQLPAEKIKDKALVIDTLRGLSAFAAEQVLAMSITPESIDAAGLWDRKQKMIEQTPGLSVWRGGETFEDLGGLDNLKGFLSKILTSGKTPVRALLYLDEIEKSLAGTAGDTSGTSQDQLGVILKEMQDRNLPGMILVGPPGTGKSSIAKAAGAVAGAPVIACDLGAMKGSLVGQSEQRIRAAMDVFQAVSQGKGLAIATCNKLVALPPELKRRFSLGTFYIDLPTDAERARIWPLWLKRYGLDKQTLPQCDSWTGAEIRACCDVAFRAGMSLVDAAAYVVPVVKSAPDQIEALRKLASGRFISASAPGVYKYNQATANTGRRIGGE
jgi:hypothetical protein